MQQILLQQLIARLPELEWKITTLGKTLPVHRLPKGLFRTRSDLPPLTFIAEIKADLEQLNGQKNENSTYYLAKRIHQKISVLVALCHLDASRLRPTDKSFGLDKLSTRQQWIQTIEDEIEQLNRQHEAIAKTLEQTKARGDTQTVLGLQAELGELQKRLTLVKETLSLNLRGLYTNCHSSPSLPS